ncbi:MAG TPA: alpha/beta hydrolase [Zeimonas sp.]|nr:alpha/beta hydrolase [Zeimonas sp.]
MSTRSDDRSRKVLVAGSRLECRLVGEPRGASGALVFLHEGLGCVSGWRDFPDRLCARVGLPGLVYSRLGYGDSDPLRGARSPRFMHDEAIVMLPALLRELDIRQPVLFGHSDGASIALIHAGTFPDVARAVVALAPHLFVEPVCVESIAAIAREYDRTNLRERLARHHRDVDGAFRGWTDVWLSDAFANWNIEREVQDSRCPILAVQGNDDQYGTMRQIERIAELRPGTRLLALPACRHSPHLDRPDDVIAATDGFLRELGLAGDPRRT